MPPKNSDFVIASAHRHSKHDEARAPIPAHKPGRRALREAAKKGVFKKK